MSLNIKNILSQKNLARIITGIILAVLFFYFNGFNILGLAMVCALGAGFYLYFARTQPELLSYSFICLAFFILYYLVIFASWPIWTILIIVATGTYLLSVNFSESDNKITPIYSFILILIMLEIFLATYQINLALIAKSLSLAVSYYLFSGLISINNNENLHLKPVLTYSTIFSLSIILLFSVGKI